MGQSEVMLSVRKRKTVKMGIFGFNWLSSGLSTSNFARGTAASLLQNFFTFSAYHVIFLLKMTGKWFLPNITTLGWMQQLFHKRYQGGWFLADTCFNVSASTWYKNQFRCLFVIASSVFPSLNLRWASFCISLMFKWLSALAAVNGISYCEADRSFSNMSSSYWVGLYNCK